MNDKFSKVEKSFNEKLLGKVGWKQFYIMVSFLVSMFVGMCALLYAGQKDTVTTMYALFERQDNKIDKVRDTVGTTQQDVSLMKGILKSAEISN